MGSGRRVDPDAGEVSRPSNYRAGTVLVVYAAGTGGWIVGLKLNATYHEFLMFVGIVVFHALIGAALGRALGIALPLLLIPVSLAAGSAGHTTGDFDTVFEFVLVTTPFNLVASAAGYALRETAERLRAR